MLSWVWGASEAADIPTTPIEGYNLLPHQYEALDRLRESFSSSGSDSDAGFRIDDLCLMRYLRARKWNADAASKMLKDTLDWRSEVGIQSWRGPRDFGWQYRKGKMYQHGVDKRGRPIIVLRSHDSPQGTTDMSILRFMLYGIEKAIQTMGPGVEQAVWLMDMSTYDLRYNGGLGFTIKLVSALQNHYPERLGHMLIMNSPAVFKPIWSCVRPFVDANTREKIQFVKKGDPLLLEMIDADVLETCFGGMCEAAYDHEEYMRTLSDLDVELHGHDARSKDEGKEAAAHRVVGEGSAGDEGAY